MELTKINKEYIDGLSYVELLKKWRFAPVGEFWFQGNTGKYWSKRMNEIREKGANHVGASKFIGWKKE